MGANHGLERDAPRDPTLEAAIRANRHDPAPYLVYADWLQQHGNSFGEYIVLSHRLLSEGSAATRDRHAQLLHAMQLASKELAIIEWRHGMWCKLKLENTADWMDAEFDAIGLGRRMFSDIACAALEELAIGVLRWDYNHQDVPAVLDVASEHAWSKDLVALRLGDVDRNIDMAHHVIGDVGDRITRAFPRLQRLFLHSSEQTWHGDVETFGVAGLDLPDLRELVVETCSMSQQRIAALLAGKLPAVEQLELWFGSTDYGATATYDDLLPLVEGRVFTRVTRLGLRNAEFTDVIAERLGDTMLAPRLETLDLSLGTLADDAALALARSARSFRRLRTLNVDDNFLTPRGLATLREAFGEVISTHQREADPNYARWVAVAE